MKQFAALAIMALSLTACAPAQPAPTPGYNTTWTWPAPATGACIGSCSYIVSTLAVAPGTNTCPPATGQYTPQQTATSALTATSWTQTGTTGQTICAVVSTYFSGATSAASTPSNVVTNPALPLAPGVPTGNATVSDLVRGPSLRMPLPQLSGKLAAPGSISGTVARR